MKKKLLSFLIVALSCINLNATNFDVTNGNDTGAGSLRQAIISANADATATAQAPHTITTDAAYSITLASALPTVSKPTIINPTGTNVLTINCPANLSSFTWGIDASPVTLNYIVIQGATAKATTASITGGAVWIGSSRTVTFNHCQFLNNEVSNNGNSYDAMGAGIYASGSTTLTINDCWFEGNVAKLTIGSNRVATGGAIKIGNTSSLTITNTTFKNNAAKWISPATGATTYGGAIYSTGTTVSCTDCTFDGNNTNGTVASPAGASYGSGSAICVLSTASTVTLTGCLVQNQTGNGAPIQIDLNGTTSAVLNISNSILKNNTNSAAPANGGYPGNNNGGAICAAAVTTITNTEISGNTALRGGGIVLYPGNATNKAKLTMTGCTVSGNNTNNSHGGGIYIINPSGFSGYTDDCTFTNCTISGNSAGTGNGGGVNLAQTNTVTFNNCTITGNSSQSNNTTSKGGGIDQSASANTNVVLNYCIVAGNNTNSTDNSKDVVVSAATKLGSVTGRNLYGGSLTFSLAGKTETSGNVVLSSAISTILNTTLADNGGTTALPGGGYVKTHALVAACSAINPTAAGSGLQTADQRGLTRDATPDMGAFEFVDLSTGLNKPLTDDIIIVKKNLITSLESGTIEVYDMKGCQILRAVDTNKLVLNANSGIYIIRLISTKGYSVKKIVI